PPPCSTPSGSRIPTSAACPRRSPRRGPESLVDGLRASTSVAYSVPRDVGLAADEPRRTFVIPIEVSERGAPLARPRPDDAQETGRAAPMAVAAQVTVRARPLRQAQRPELLRAAARPEGVTHIGITSLPGPAVRVGVEGIALVGGRRRLDVRALRLHPRPASGRRPSPRARGPPDSAGRRATRRAASRAHASGATP